MIQPGSLTIRNARQGDAPTLMVLYLEHLTKTPPREPQEASVWEKQLASLTRTPGYHILIGETGGQAVSSVTLVVVQNLTHNLRPYALIENVVTHAGHRGKGYATALMARAADIARENGCYKIMLMTGSKRESTLSFYERCGYSRYDKTGFILRL